MVNNEVKKFPTNILGLFQGLKRKGISLAKEIKQIFVNDAVRLNYIILLLFLKHCEKK